MTDFQGSLKGVGKLAYKKEGFFFIMKKLSLVKGNVMYVFTARVFQKQIPMCTKFMQKLANVELIFNTSMYCTIIYIELKLEFASKVLHDYT